MARVLLFLLASLAAVAPTAAQPLPCAAALVSTVQEMLDSLRTLGLPAPAAHGLEATARLAIAAAERGDIPAALRRLTTLENRVRALVRSGRLDAATADTLIAFIEQLRGVLLNCTAVPPLTALNCRSGVAENELMWLSPPGAHVATTILYRTDGYPRGPNDPAASLLGSFAGAPDQVGRATHASLVNGTRYYYAAFSDDGSGELSPGRLSFGRPQPTDDGFRWSYTAGGSGLPVIGGSAGLLATLSSAGFAFGLEVGPAGGRWVHAPAQLRAPAPARPIAIPSPAAPFADGLVVVTSLDGRVWGLDGATGQALWVSPFLGGELQASVCGMFRAFGGSDDVLMVGTAGRRRRARFHGLRPSDGSLLWSFDDAGGDGIGAIEASCAVDYARLQVYFTSQPAPGGGRDTVWALSLGAGSASKAWSFPVADASTAPVVNEDAVYIGTATGEVHAVDGDDGVARWAVPYSTGDGPVESFVFPQRGTGRVAFSTSRQVHLIRDDGPRASALWSPPVTLDDPNVPLILGDEILVADADGQVSSLDARQAQPTVVVFARFGDGVRNASPGLPYFDLRFGLYAVGTREGVLYAVQRR